MKIAFGLLNCLDRPLALLRALMRKRQDVTDAPGFSAGAVDERPLEERAKSMQYSFLLMLLTVLRSSAVRPAPEPFGRMIDSRPWA